MSSITIVAETDLELQFVKVGDQKIISSARARGTRVASRAAALLNFESLLIAALPYFEIYYCLPNLT